MKRTFFAAALAFSAALPASAQEISAAGFVQQAASSDLFEIGSSELALDRSENPAVREFATMMIEDHTTVSKRLMVMANQHGIQMPTEPTGIPAELLQTVEAASGDAFDANYIEAQTAGHQAAVELYSTYAENGDDEALRSFAEANLPTLVAHLQMLEGMRAD